MFKILENTKLQYALSNFSDGNMSLRYGSGEEVLNNRKKFFNKARIPLDKCVGIHLVHDSKIIAVSEQNASYCAVKVEEGDALLTDKKEIFLFMTVADCLPVIIFDPVKEVLALVHCGWRSTEEKLIQKVILKMINDYRSKAENILVAIGPGIHKESYKKANHAVRNLEGWEPFVADLPDGEAAVDLVGYNVFQLEQEGVLSENIEISSVDTAKDKNYFSHYRSKVSGEPEGRFCAVVGMK